MIFGNLLALFAVFSMFGDIIDGLDFSMFDLAFGLKVNDEYVIGPSSGLAILFIFVLACIIISLYYFICLIYGLIKYPHYTVVSFADNHTIEPIVLSVFSLVVIILSFCSLHLINNSIMEALEIIIKPKLGVGPIVLSIMNILTILSLIGGSIAMRLDKSLYVTVNKTQNNDTTMTKEIKTTTDLSQQTKQIKISEEEKIVLLEKYHNLLENKIITEEEFTNKKKQILNE